VSKEEDKLIKRFEFCLIFVTLKPLNENQVLEVFSSFSRISSNIYGMKDFNYDHRESKRKIVIIDSIKSLSNFVNRYKSLMLEIGYSN
ncbi:MAG: hypothetical protein AB1775_10595, partial [Bacteroidota bacterium]